MWITVINWDKYNPRNDVKQSTWFRLENTFYVDATIYRLSNDGKIVWITLLALASQHQNGTFECDIDYIASTLRIQPEDVAKTLEALQSAGKITKAALRPRHVRVTPTSRKRTATDERTDGRTDVLIRGRRDRVQTWPPDHPLARCFANLMAVPPYAAVFDLGRDTQTLEAHRDRHSLTVADLEQVTWEYRCWADGPAGERIRSPRGTLATFVGNYVKRPKGSPALRSVQAPGPTVDELYGPVITREEDCY